MKTVSELIDAAEETFRSEDSRLENERCESEQRRKDEWNGRVKSLQDKVAREKENHNSRPTKTIDESQGTWAVIGLVVGYILGIILFLIDNTKVLEAVFWPILSLLAVLAVCFRALAPLQTNDRELARIYNMAEKEMVEAPLILLPAIIFPLISSFVIGPWLATREEERRHAEHLEQIRTEGEWLKLSGQTTEELRGELEQAKIR